MTKTESFQPPAPGNEIAHSLAKAALNAVPLVGGSAAELYDLVVRPGLGRRQQAWMSRVGEALDEYRRKGMLTMEGLADNEQFLTVLLQSSQAASRNHQEEKLEALKNAVLNSALPCPLDETLQQLFVQYVDFFTAWHIRIIELFADSPAWFQRNGRPHPATTAAISGSLEQVLLAAYPEMNGQGDLYNQLAKDLHARGLFGHDNFGGMMSVNGMLSQRSTDLGRKFLAFITKPEVK